MNARANQRIDLQSQPVGPSRSKWSAINLAIACAAVGIFFTRPTAFGEVYSLQGSALMLASAIAIFILVRGKVNFTFATTVPLLFAVLTVYMLIIDILKQSSNIDDAPKSAMISLAAICCLFLISMRKEYSRIFYDTLSFIVLAFCTSIIITFSLLCTGVPAQKLTLFHFNYTYRPPSGDILFPFTLRNNSGFTWIGFIPRLAGAFREVGLLPAFACWAAFYLAARQYNIIFSVICLAASAVCLSTLGVPLAVVTSVAVIAQRSRLPNYIFTTVAPICGAILFAATWNLPYVGIGYKIKYVNDSFRDRINGMEGLFTTQDILFGDGTSTDITGAINLPSMITRYGVVGFMLVLTIYAMALRNPKFFLGALTATVVTMMTTQPAGADPLVICLFMSWFALNERLPAATKAKLRSASPLRPHARPAT